MEAIELLKEFTKLRKRNVHLIAVANSEWYSLFKDEIRNSIAIEGIFANRNELLDVLEKNKRTSEAKSAAILGYYEAASTLYEYANNLYSEGEFSTRVSDIKQIHTLLMRYEKQSGIYTGELGEFRKEGVAVTQSRFTPLEGIYVRDVMPVLVRWINKKIAEPGYDKIKLAALCHVLFETIHPFRNGNGRAGRILLSYILIGCGYCNIAIKGNQQSDRDKYYAAMEEGDDEFESLLRGIEKGKKISTDTIDAYAERSNIEKLYRIIIKRLHDSFRRLSEKEFVASHPDAVLPLRDAARYFNYSQDYLRNLINKGKLAAERRGKLWYVRVREVERYIKEISEE
jgi:excisionase family DNA binding protein